MGTTFVRYNGREFEAHDAQAEIWLIVLVQQIDRLPQIPDWLKEARTEWLDEAREGHSMGVQFALDGIVGHDDRKRRELLMLSERATSALKSLGVEISADHLNALREGNGGRGTFHSDLPTEYFTSFGDHVVKLLQGTLGPDESDARPWIHKPG